MSRRLPRFTLKSWLLIILMPVFGLIILTAAVRIYGDLTRIILSGFDGKLSAISTTTAAFVEPADQARLVGPLPLGGLSGDLSGRALWGIDSENGTLITIAPTTGHLAPTSIKVPEGADNLSTGLVPGELLMLDGANGKVLRLSTATGETQQSFQLNPPLTAIATDVAHGELYAAGRFLERYNLRTGETTKMRELSTPYRDLTFDPKHDVLWALNARGNELFELNRTDGSVRRKVKLMTEKPDDAPTTWQAEPVELITMVYDATTDSMLGTSTSLVRINTQTGAVSAKGFVAAFGQEQGPIYRRYAAAMGRIIHRTKLTFLYTQAVSGRNRITYGIDGTMGKNHSPLLSVDVLPESEIAGIQRLMTEGSLHVTEVRHWQEWGLIKSAFAPLFDATGRPMGMAGADVDITTIQYQMREALVITFGAGVVTLVIAGILILFIARQLTVPLAKIKAAALHAAAGDYTRHASVIRPSELRDLASRFSQTTAAIGHHVVELRETVLARQAARDHAALIRRLAVLPPLAAHTLAGASWAWGSTGAQSAAQISPGGAVQADGLALAWLSRLTGNALADASRRNEIAVTVDALLSRYRADHASLIAALGALFAEHVEAWALLTTSGAHLLVRRPGLLHRRTADGQLVEVSATDFSALQRPAHGEALVLSNAAAFTPTPGGTGPEAAALFDAIRQGTPTTQPTGFVVVIAFPSK
jgi:hypothetical protein